MSQNNDCSDTFFMHEALQLAQNAADAGEVPVGAVVVRENKIIARGYNCPVSGHDPAAHAEIIALRRAGAALENYRLTGCDLYVTTEPCSMCAGAMVHARIRRLIFGCREPKAGAVVSCDHFFRRPYLNHTVQVSAGVLAQESGALLQQFFRGRRHR